MELFFYSSMLTKESMKIARSFLLRQFLTKRTKLFAQLLKIFPHDVIRLCWLTEEKGFHGKNSTVKWKKGRFFIMISDEILFVDWWKFEFFHKLGILWKTNYWRNVRIFFNENCENRAASGWNFFACKVLKSTANIHTKLCKYKIYFSFFDFTL